MAVQKSALLRSLRTYQVFGANTNVGKTIISTILCKAFLRKYPNEAVHYLKPVSTGELREADDRHLSRFSAQTKTHCLFQFDEAVSPHIAARSSKFLPDEQICDQVLTYVKECAESGPGTILLETAGGVHSPTPSGGSQADLFRHFRFPVCLVADHRLGGISATISAFESLHIRGFDLECAFTFEDQKYQNHEYLEGYFRDRGIHSLSLPPPPERGNTDQEDFDRMSDYYESTSASEIVDEIVSKMSENHNKRIKSLERLPSEADKHIWYPFTQHREVSPQTIIAIDSAHGDFFQTFNAGNSSMSSANESILDATFDGSGSWWTQGLGHGNPALSLAAAYAAGRYGHVLFPGMIHQPAMELATNLLNNLRNPRLQKVFYSDNGSTGVEVAVKMALTASFKRYGWNIPRNEVGVLGLKGSYHGDTIGAMDCSEPSTFNEKVHWYAGRGYWFEFPQVKMVKGIWTVEPPPGIADEFGEAIEFDDLSAIFDIQSRVESVHGQRYRRYIKDTLKTLVREKNMTFGALIMEPVILGAGGMLFVDPLFQHALVEVVRDNPQIFGHPNSPDAPSTNDWSGLPVIFDEVFTGIYRLGRFSAASFLQTLPDISVHAKLLTGGLIPLCTTLASNSIYESFLAPEKSEALLHGHSYTAHPIGCHVANTSIAEYIKMDTGDAWTRFKNDWRQENATINAVEAWSVWSKDFVVRISLGQEVESVVTLGSVLAIKLRDSNPGYSSKAAVQLQKQLLEQSEGFRIHVRVLGNVLYIMSSQTSEPETLRRIENILGAILTPESI